MTISNENNSVEENNGLIIKCGDVCERFANYCLNINQNNSVEENDGLIIKCGGMCERFANYCLNIKAK